MAELTLAGVMGGAHALDGPADFYPTLCDETPTFPDVVDDLELSSAIVETVLKRYPFSGTCQPVVRLTERLARRATQVPSRAFARHCAGE
jgi:2-methylcitrate dehydratase PrpD